MWQKTVLDPESRGLDIVLLCGHDQGDGADNRTFWVLLTDTEDSEASKTLSPSPKHSDL